MLYQIAQSESACLEPLCSPLKHHLVIDSILEGKTPGRIYTDRPTHPQAAWINFKHHCFLVGKPDLLVFNEDLKAYLNQSFVPQALASGLDALLFDCYPAGWSILLDQLIPGQQPRRYPRQYFACQALQQDWRLLLPAGFRVVSADADLLEQTHLANLAEVRDEMCSERISVQDFLENSFGFCIQRRDELVAWAFSEYNAKECCEVGIATVEKYRRQGLGTVVALALVEHALKSGYHTIGWHCWASNLPSAALARRAGFEHRLDYEVDLFILPVQS